jgi:hypothetical protein
MLNVLDFKQVYFTNGMQEKLMQSSTLKKGFIHETLLVSG